MHVLLAAGVLFNYTAAATMCCSTTQQLQQCAVQLHSSCNNAPQSMPIHSCEHPQPETTHKVQPQASNLLI